LAWADASIAPNAMMAEISKLSRLLEEGAADGSPGRVRSGSFMARAKRGFAVIVLVGRFLASAVLAAYGDYMNIPRTQAILACSLLIASIFSAPAFAQGQGVIATWDCPQRSGHAPRAAASPAPAQYSPVKELEQYVAQLQAELEKSDRSRSKRTRR
jgi:hypothetical protein